MPKRGTYSEPLDRKNPAILERGMSYFIFADGGSRLRRQLQRLLANVCDNNTLKDAT